jgi:hypothetical protein
LRHTLDDRFTPIEETMSALNDLVKAGKVRYVGISDAPAWKVAQAQVVSHFRGWNPLIALQIEYSLPGWGVLVRALHPHFSTGKTLLSSLGSRFVANSQVGPTTIFDRSIRNSLDALAFFFVRRILMPTGPFTAAQFVSTQWNTTEGKAKFGNTYLHFVDSEFKRTLFTKQFYNQLSNCFFHIAHYVECVIMWSAGVDTA